MANRKVTNNKKAKSKIKSEAEIKGKVEKKKEDTKEEKAVESPRQATLQECVRQLQGKKPFEEGDEE